MSPDKTVAKLVSLMILRHLEQSLKLKVNIEVLIIRTEILVMLRKKLHFLKFSNKGTSNFHISSYF